MHMAQPCAAIGCAARPVLASTRPFLGGFPFYYYYYLIFFNIFFYQPLPARGPAHYSPPPPHPPLPPLPLSRSHPLHCVIKNQAFAPRGPFSSLLTRPNLNWHGPGTVPPPPSVD
ncbi:hypothetical protein IF1G_05653 [Cordyceps javanica]|uniref:Uncharacterized protein n=1 Tax=Cordyceps javanica TaxID=43265 RepID=A0A545V291_9HYPO|nr:hypothetical protein IF1G_05653 [Cordyceps javanica]